MENDFEYTIKEKCRQILLVAMKKLKNPKIGRVLKHYTQM